MIFGRIFRKALVLPAILAGVFEPAAASGPIKETSVLDFTMKTVDERGKLWRLEHRGADINF